MKLIAFLGLLGAAQACIRIRALQTVSVLDALSVLTANLFTTQNNPTIGKVSPAKTCSRAKLRSE